jgi:hypothetical protein
VIANSSGPDKRLELTRLEVKGVSDFVRHVGTFDAKSLPSEGRLIWHANISVRFCPTIRTKSQS